jgi:hypothetical protein
MFAPIALYTYNRLTHTRLTVEALQKNTLASQSDLIIFSDAPKSKDHTSAVNSIRDYIRQIEGFNSITIIERETNYGLARNIIEGVTEICNQYGRVIVLEDDIVTSPFFLAYLNRALDKYANEKQVWHISGWNYPIDPDGLEEAFFWRVMNCWGWATWSDRWRHFHKDPVKLTQSWSRQMIKRFNLDGTCDFWSQVKLNASGELNSWAIFWYATIFEQGGFCLNPARSLVCNIGHDGSGENCDESLIYSHSQLSDKIDVLPFEIEESVLALQKVKLFYKNIKGSWQSRIVRYFLRKVRKN